MIAAATKPTVNPGNTMWRSQPAGSSNSGRYPDVGSQPSVVANSAISRMPNQKSGIDTPNWLVRRTMASETRPSRSADQMPAGGAGTTASTKPNTPRGTGGGGGAGGGGGGGGP